jgi:hypothetical protein
VAKAQGNKNPPWVGVLQIEVYTCEENGVTREELTGAGVPFAQIEADVDEHSRGSTEWAGGGQSYTEAVVGVQEGAEQWCKEV